jgi:hypothetical protein
MASFRRSGLIAIRAGLLKDRWGVGPQVRDNRRAWSQARTSSALAQHSNRSGGAPPGSGRDASRIKSGIAHRKLEALPPQQRTCGRVPSGPPGCRIAEKFVPQAPTPDFLVAEEGLEPPTHGL